MKDYPQCPLLLAIFHLLRDINSVFRSNNRIILKDYGITLIQFHALQAVKEETITMGELCDILELASSTVTELVDRLEKKNLLKRVRDQQDRRVVRLRLCPLGQRLIEQVEQHNQSFLDDSAGVMMSQEEIQNLYTLLKQFKKGIHHQS